MTHVTQGNDLLTWKRSFEPLFPWCLPNPLPSACQLLFVEIQRPDGKRSSRFRSAPGTQEAPRRLSQSLRLVSHCTNPCPQLSSEARPLNCESATTKVLPSSHFSTLGTSTLGTSPQEQPAPTSSSTPGSRPRADGHPPKSPRAPQPHPPPPPSALATAGGSAEELHSVQPDTGPWLGISSRVP